MTQNPKDPECVCHGNWRAIVEEMEPLFDKEYVDENGALHRLSGVLWASDDFYYAMWNPATREMKLLTCVGRLAEMGFKLASSEDASR